MRSVSVLKSSALGHDDLFADGEIDLVFVGDSITHNWEGARGPGSDYGGKPLAELKKSRLEGFQGPVPQSGRYVP
jgi:hypothetical protein